MLRMNQMSLPYVDEKTGKSAINGEGWKTFNETAFIAPMVAGGYKEFFAKYNKGPYTPEFFQTQQSATFALLSSSMLIDKGFETLNWDLVALPTFKELPGVGSQGSPTYFSVTSNSRHKNEAMEVINYLVSEEAQAHLSRKGVMTSLKNEAVQKLYGSESKWKDKNLKAVFFNKFAPIPYKTIYDTGLESPYVKFPATRSRAISIPRCGKPRKTPTSGWRTRKPNKAQGSDSLCPKGIVLCYNRKKTHGTVNASIPQGRLRDR